MTTNKYTPQIISARDMRFNIPIYQRLFEWDSTMIECLLDDLYNAYISNKANPKPYYIGLLTSYHNAETQTIDLVDGQQRFIVLMLMGIVFKWDKFVKNTDKLRLTFFARPQDEEYLASKVFQKDAWDVEYINLKMQKGMETIQKYCKDKDEANFAEYIYKHLTFFISELPKSYNASDLNKHFERLNEAGKGLENHEILKVHLLKQMTDHKEQCTRIWNIVSQMDKPIIRQRNNESPENYAQRYEKAIETIQHIINENTSIDSLFEKEKGNSLINDLHNESVNTDEYQPIQTIKPDKNKPAIQHGNQGFHAILSFPEFLLEILYMLIEKSNPDISVNEFFDPNHLQDSFKVLEKEQIEPFFQHLLLYRLLFDRYVIRITDGDATYSIDAFDTEDVIQYQSMLYVNSSSKSYYLWLPKLLCEVKDNLNIEPNELLAKLKQYDNMRHPCPTIEDLTYQNIDRYWFWRLDYYLWERRNELFKENESALAVANKYLFRRSRSVEHILPQHPRGESLMQWEGKSDEKIMNSFGNLAMISSSHNSSLQNASFTEKKARVESFVKGDINGTIESLKMLYIYQHDTWDKAKAIQHGEEMFKILKDSYSHIVKKNN